MAGLAEVPYSVTFWLSFGTGVDCEGFSCWELQIIV